MYGYHYFDENDGDIRSVAMETPAQVKARKKRNAKRKVARYLKTLRRVPDDIVLSTATRHLNLATPSSCLCGTFIRESLSQMRQTAFERTQSNHYGSSNLDQPEMCEVLFGGKDEDWDEIFSGVVEEDAPFIEEAFVTRVLEAVESE